MVALGRARRLWYQAGFKGAPAREATTTYPSACWVYATDTVHGRPLFARVVVRSRTGAPLKTPVGRPAALKAAIMGWFRSPAPSAAMRRLYSATSKPVAALSVLISVRRKTRAGNGQRTGWRRPFAPRA